MAFVSCRIRRGLEVFSVEYQPAKSPPNTKRESIYLGKDARSRHAAEEIRKHVDAILEAAEHSEPVDKATKRWIKSIEGKSIHAKLIGKGLIESPVEVQQAKAADSLTIAELCQRFLSSGTATSKKQATQTKFKQATDCLLRYWSPETRIRSITVGDAEEWQAWIAVNGNARNKNDKTLSPATIGRRTKLARQIFTFALKHKWLDANPFLSLNIPSDENEERLHYVSCSIIDDVIECSTSAEWRLLIALARYGGLRCPSEIRGMKWGHVNLEHGRLTVLSPKTEHLNGKARRVCPIFPELRPYFIDLLGDGKCPDSYVLSKVRKLTGLGSHFERLLEQAGHDRWERLFQNLRSSRATDLLANGHAVKTVANWLGNSPEVLLRHYAQATDEDFQRALGDSLRVDSSKSPPFSPPSEGILPPSAPFTRQRGAEGNTAKTKENVGFAGDSPRVKGKKIGRQGLEPRTKGL